MYISEEFKRFWAHICENVSLNSNDYRTIIEYWMATRPMSPMDLLNYRKDWTVLRETGWTKNEFCIFIMRQTGQFTRRKEAEKTGLFFMIRSKKIRSRKRQIRWNRFSHKAMKNPC